MNIAVFSFKNHNVEEGMSQLVNKYKDKNPTILLPVLRQNEDFTQSVIKTSIDNKNKITCFFDSAVGLDHLLKQADDIHLTDNPVKEVLRHLKPGDAVGIVWDDSPQAHFVVHSLEDLALDTWDIYEGLDSIEVDEFDFSLDEESIHEEMISTLGKFVDLMCAFVASTVLASLGEAVAEHMQTADEDDDKKDIDPFNYLE